MAISVAAKVIGPAAMVRSSFAACNRVGILIPSKHAAPTPTVRLALMTAAGQTAWSSTKTTINTTTPLATASGNAVIASRLQVLRNHTGVAPGGAAQRLQNCTRRGAAGR